MSKKKFEVNVLHYYMLVVSVVVLSICLCYIGISRIVNWWQISHLSYDISPLLEPGETLEEWMNRELESQETSVLSNLGERYYDYSKEIAKDVTEFLNFNRAISYKGNGKKFEHMEQFAPVIFRWQCEFDSMQGKIYSFDKKEYFDVWYDFVRQKLEDKDSDYRINYREPFEDAMSRSYGNL